MKKNRNSTKGLSAVGNLFASSMIITLLDRLAEIIYQKLGSGFFGGIFTSYDSLDGITSSSALITHAKRININERIFKPVKQKTARTIENSAILDYIKAMLERLLSSSMKTYGIFMFAASLYSAIVYVFKTFFFTRPQMDNPIEAIDSGVVITLVFMLIASVIMIASRMTLVSALLKSPIARFALFDVIGIRREALEGYKEREGRFHIAFVIGIMFGVVSYFVKPLYLLLGIAGLIAAFLVLIRPEFGVVAIITALPFAPTMSLVAAVLYTAICFFIKVIRGKRSIKLDFLDGTILLFMILMIGGGFIAASRASMKPMLVYVAFMLAYFLVVNLIRSKEWIMRCVIGVVASGSMVALYGLYQNFFGTVDQTWQDADMFSQIEGRVVSTFENPNVLAEYLIMILPLILALFLNASAPRKRLAFAIAGLAVGGCLIYTWSRGAWLGFMIGIVLFMLMYSRHTLTAILFGSFAIPFLPFVLPESITQRFLSIGNLGDSSTSYRVNIWRGVFRMIKDYWQSGVGIGTDSFRCVYPYYSLAAIESAPHSHNLYLQITVELGIIGLIVFLAVLFTYVQSSFTLHAKEKRVEKLLSTAIFCGIFSVLAQGMTDYIWYNYRVFLMFWMLIGLGAAVRRTLFATAVKQEYL